MTLLASFVSVPVSVWALIAGLEAIAPSISDLTVFGLFDGFGLEPAHLVGAGGAIGAIARHWVYTRLTRPDNGFPRATVTVNVIGSFVFGAAVFAGWGESTIQFLGIGICGAFTTFSSFSVETVQLWEVGKRRLAVVNAVANLVLSLAAIGFAWILVTGGPF